MISVLVLPLDSRMLFLCLSASSLSTMKLSALACVRDCSDKWLYTGISMEVVDPVT